MRCKNTIILLLLLSSAAVNAQLPLSPFDLPDYKFIHYDINHLELVDQNKTFDRLFSRLDTLIRKGNNQIRIVHFGGSHIQADIYTHRIRQEMQSFYPGVLGSRGFFFPYTIAKTNSPSNLNISYKGEWITGKNTQSEQPYILGVSGITSSLQSDTGEIRVVARYDTLRNYDFNRVRLFCNVTESQIIPELHIQVPVRKYSVDTSSRCIEYILEDYTDTLCFTVFQPDSVSVKFELYGISLENDDPGVIYNAIGVNGAKLSSYLRCELFVSQLKALKPNLVIISIGTNEGNTRNFKNEEYRQDYLNLLDSVAKAAPEAAVLLTVPNDSYLLKRYVNRNTALIRETIFDIARSSNYGVWDFYAVMGGLNSASIWYDYGLMNKDHIHFNKQGYLLKGELLYAAIMKSWEEHLKQKNPLLKEVLVHPIPDSHLTNEF